MDLFRISETEEEIVDSNVKSMFYLENRRIPYVDDWIPLRDDIVFKTVDKAIILPVSDFFNIDDKDLDYFVLSPKRCYNKPELRAHMCQYLNYFTKFFDEDKELISILMRIKYFIDYDKNYTKDDLYSNLKRYIYHNKSILFKLYAMNEHCYQVELGGKKGKSITSLQYTTKHGKYMMQMSILMLMSIPVCCHYMYVNKVDNVDEFLLYIFDEIVNSLTDVDIASKYYETASTEVTKNYNYNKGLWMLQDIRGKNTTTHSRFAIENIILQLMPKYRYDNNVVSLNFSSIRRSNGYKVTDIKYEYTFTIFSSSNRDEDFNSDFDKFESNLIKESDALYIQNKVASEYTMKFIKEKFSTCFNDSIISKYRERLQENGSPVINKFQKKLIFNLFYKYFGDPVSADAINEDDYITLMVISKEMLQSMEMIILPYIISGKVIKIPNKKTVNKSELKKITDDETWKLIDEKYRSEKIKNDILSELASLLVSDFKIIDLNIPEIDGKQLPIIPDIIIKEYLNYVLYI